MVPKALWIATHEPEVFRAAKYVCEYQDYLNFHLTGVMAASVNNASVRWHYNSSTGDAGGRYGGRGEGRIGSAMFSVDQICDNTCPQYRSFIMI
jgi:hypothetical protein